MICIALPKRGTDCHGSGHFGASRGSRPHKGQDYECSVGDIIVSPTEGRITKIGYPYADDLSYRYVEITFGGLRHRIMYIKPLSKIVVGDYIRLGARIGIVQNLDRRYPGITIHVHYDIKDTSGEYLDPNLFELTHR